LKDLKSVIVQQEEKILEVEDDIRILEQEIEHEKYIIEKEKKKEAEKDEKILTVIDRIKNNLP
jgi:hypothetical protein